MGRGRYLLSWKWYVMQYERIADSSKANDTKKKDAEQAVEKYGSSKAESTAGYMSKLEKLAPSVEFGIGNTHSSAKSGKTLTINQKLLEKMQDDPNKEKEMKEIDSMSWGSNISVQITNSAFEKMMVDKEFKNKMMNIIREDAHGSNMMCGGTLINIDENGYKGYSYMQSHTKEAGRAFEAHSKDKDSFYSKKCKKDELNELWEKERLKKRQYQEKADDEYMESLRLKEIFQHKEDVAKLYEEKTVKK